MRRYKINYEQYTHQLTLQNYLCAICKKPETALIKDRDDGKIKMLAVDHNHSTGQVRKLLCQRCNMCLGLIDDDIRKAKAILDYLLEA